MFLVTWTGGWEAPALDIRGSLETAESLSDYWFQEAQEGDQVNIYRLATDTSGRMCLTPESVRVKE